VVTYIERAIEHKDIDLGAFLDIEGAFPRKLFDIIKEAAEKHGIEPAMCRWISAMLESRTITATLSGETLGASASRGCPQGAFCRLYFGVWLWVIFCGDLMMMGIIQQDMLMIWQYSYMENSLRQ
jgi:hypothetical protein